MTSPISITTLSALASAGVLRTVQLVGQVGGYTVMVRVGQVEKQLTGQRGTPRVFASLDTAAAQLLALGVTVFEVLPANYVRAPKVYRRGRPAALKELAKLQREGKPAKRAPAKKPAGAAVATAPKILPSDRAQLKLPGLPRTRKPARTAGAGAWGVS
ncbi:hypothetical protein XppCFBP6982P_23020 (plasmid) [Xanthomonas phaseoli pv. phaseoli]|uniref:Uncharacterized protein n=1 Tax=Xanthomonas campestris pv. phaseoli TaxID=317013 RepID=A0AB38E6I5_XANCH|nr:hypothetical protein [Xanthomonas phaseoli]ATS24097.1 hypothetical protein XppCFBP412P_22595 [Xanthomonas phaseoli pv. phaseoli]KHD60566.1 hypothetical protein PK68_19220 [Xanthomonas phaseoli pv. phaseoli]KHD60838.1 hypothetical protein PK63_19405 [Xanthomonas phaseoli pv. phaseoli]KHS21141.1 hypothetical protein RM66_20970 [Xanthomonas phaseoli pv. phaseoli]QTG35677.1 hypothetical protein XppCFBP6982P_23020 [Xanthomonas phaseoli pv. phaseoli]